MRHFFVFDHAHLTGDIDCQLGSNRVDLDHLALFGALQLIAVVRYSSQLSWTGTAAWVYLVYIASFLIVGGYGTYVARDLPPGE